MRDVDGLRREMSQIQSLSAGIQHLERKVSKLKALDGRIKTIAKLQQADERASGDADDSRKGKETNRQIAELGPAKKVDASVGDKNLVRFGLPKPL